MNVGSTVKVFKHLPNLSSWVLPFFSEIITCLNWIHAFLKYVRVQAFKYTHIQLIDVKSFETIYISIFAL